MEYEEISMEGGKAAYGTHGADEETMSMLRGTRQKRPGVHFDNATGRWGGRAWIVAGVVTLGVLSAAGSSSRSVST